MSDIEPAAEEGEAQGPEGSPSPEEIEARFRARQRARMLPILRFGLVVGSTLFPGFLVWDVFITRVGVSGTLPLRLGLGALFVALGLSTFVPRIARHAGVVLAAAVTAGAAGVCLVAARLPDGHVFALAALMLMAIVVSVVATTMRVALVACVLLLVSANVTMVLTAMPALAFWGVNLFVVPGVVVAGALAFLTERNDRRAFQLELDLERERATLERLARTDPLTGVNNRRSWFERARQALQLAKRHDRPLSVLILDIDHFKKINDRHGHLAGDDTLRAITRACQATLRSTDVFGRIGGEEFAVLLPETELDSAITLAERLRTAVAELPTGLIGRSVACTLSVGVATLGPEESTIRLLLHAADQALYQAKREGRNRVSVRPAA